MDSRGVFLEKPRPGSWAGAMGCVIDKNLALPFWGSYHAVSDILPTGKAFKVRTDPRLHVPPTAT